MFCIRTHIINVAVVVKDRVRNPLTSVINPVISSFYTTKRFHCKFFLHLVECFIEPLNIFGTLQRDVKRTLGPVFLTVNGLHESLEANAFRINIQTRCLTQLIDAGIYSVIIQAPLGMIGMHPLISILKV